MLRFGMMGGDLGGRQFPNLIPNSIWDGMSGNKVPDDNFTLPNEWNDAFSTAENREAIDLGDHVGFKVTDTVGGRANLVVTVPSRIGIRYNVSIVHDTIIGQSGGNICTINNGGTEIRNMGSPDDGTSGRIDMIVEATDTTMTFRMGLGTTTNQTGEYTLSHPQITEGETLRDYMPTT